MCNQKRIFKAIQNIECPTDLDLDTSSARQNVDLMGLTCAEKLEQKRTSVLPVRTALGEGLLETTAGLDSRRGRRQPFYAAALVIRPLPLPVY